MSTHTPGPWTIEKYTGHPHIEIWTNNNRPQRIAYMQDHLPEVEADAQLIASAPELLAALEATLIPLMRLGDFIGNTDSGGASGLGAFDRCAIIGQVRDAIDKAKAEGREGE